MSSRELRDMEWRAEALDEGRSSLSVKHPRNYTTRAAQAREIAPAVDRHALATEATFPGGRREVIINAASWRCSNITVSVWRYHASNFLAFEMAMTRTVYGRSYHYRSSSEEVPVI